jgi:hypothetical protein
VAAHESVKEALDHLLDPLDLSAAPTQASWDDVGVEPAERRAYGVSRAGVAAFLLRARRSRRLLYRIPRLLLAWTALIAGISVLIWITFSAAGLK